MKEASGDAQGVCGGMCDSISDYLLDYELYGATKHQGFQANNGNRNYSALNAQAERYSPLKSDKERESSTAITASALMNLKEIALN